MKQNCSLCNIDTAGNHEWNCPNNPNKFSYQKPQEFPKRSKICGNKKQMDKVINTLIIVICQEKECN